MLTNPWVEPAGCFFYVVDVVDISLRSDALLPAVRQWAEVMWWRRHNYSWCALVTTTSTVLQQNAAAARLFVWTSGCATFSISNQLLLLLLPHALGSTAITASSCQQPLISEGIQPAPQQSLNLCCTYLQTHNIMYSEHHRPYTVHTW